MQNENKNKIKDTILKIHRVIVLIGEFVGKLMKLLVILQLWILVVISVLIAILYPLSKIFGW